MRKKVISATFAIALATVAGYGIYNAQNKVVLSDSAKANVEALASEESGSRHTLECGSAGIKACSSTCNKCNVTLTTYGNGRTATLICYQ